MGRTIILAGAPAADFLDWTAVEPETEPGTTRPWRTNIKSTDIDATSHPEWRVVPSQVPGEVPAAQPNVRPLDEAIQTERSIEPPGGTDSRPYLSYGRAEFLDLTQATQESTQNSTQDGTHQPGSLAIPSLDDASLSFRLPNALPQMPSELPSLPLATASFTSSQEFLKHSLAVHDALPSSLPVFDLPPTYKPNANFDETTMSMPESVLLSFSPKRLPPLPTDIPRWQPLTHLADVPSAEYLLSVAPQTVSVNIVVAIVSVGAPRVVGNNNSNDQNSNRRRDRPLASLVELVVGDETRSGFGLTIWMDGAAPSGPSSLVTLLPSLAPHDVVLLRHVALHVFGDKVYGSSLRKDQTKMHILHCGGRSGHLQRVLAGDALFSVDHIEAVAGQLQTGTQASSSYPADLQLLAKTARVRNWALRYVIVNGIGV
ncbi:hypothetical protein Sste5346_003604 [Sporothrix stenoceras]|uniref:Uncharacterized protein n=1 Tax=Sporothrix stenoceras TaxID=5173 RepID=A0ABR3ZEI2_9PEZI